MKGKDSYRTMTRMSFEKRNQEQQQQRDNDKVCISKSSYKHLFKVATFWGGTMGNRKKMKDLFLPFYAF